MSNKSEKTSEKEQDEQKSDSVYDFLYYDRQRVASFLAQFDDSGHLQQITESKSASKGAKRGFKVGLGGGATIMGTGGQGNVNLERMPGELGTEGIERVYDPLWTNALVFLDYLEERGLIQQDVKSARIGQFVLATGSLSITDLPMLRKVLEIPAMKAIIVAQFQSTIAAQLAAAQAQAQAQAAQTAPQPNAAPAPAAQAQLPLQMQAALAPVLMEVVPLMPQFLQATLDGGDYSVWCGLIEQWLAGTSADLALKHGYQIPGEWALLGIVDALPGPLPSTINVPAIPFGGVQHQGPHAQNLAVAARQTFGRPADAYGVTPLLIFREVKP